MENLDMRETMSSIEAILFASGEPVALERLSDALELPAKTVSEALRRLMDQYSYERRGIRLIQINDQFQLVSAPEYGDLIRRVLEVRKPAKLSQSAMEVLTIVAYYQPTTKAYIDQIRGVDSAYTVSLLLERHFIEECGRLQVAGRPHLYRTTDEFLRVFHLSSLEELPAMPGLDPDGTEEMEQTVIDEGSSEPSEADAESLRE